MRCLLLDCLCDWKSLSSFAGGLSVKPVALLLVGLAGHLTEELFVVVLCARHVAVLALEDLVELTAVEEDTAALAAGVDADAAAFHLDELATARGAWALGGHAGKRTRW